jgi:hypothetical protein
MQGNLRQGMIKHGSAQSAPKGSRYLFSPGTTLSITTLLIKRHIAGSYSDATAEVVFAKLF